MFDISYNRSRDETRRYEKLTRMVTAAASRGPVELGPSHDARIASGGSSRTTDRRAVPVWPDLNFETGVLTVRAALQRVDKKLMRVEPKSVTSRRSLQLPAVCHSVFARLKADQDAQRKWSGSRWQETGYVFTTRIGTPVDPRTLLREYYAITRPKAKRVVEEPPKRPFPPIRFHDLRHSAATLLLAQGVSPRYISDLLGHSQVSFTLQTYAHILPEVQKQVAARMDALLTEPYVPRGRSGLSTKAS